MPHGVRGRSRQCPNALTPLRPLPPPQAKKSRLAALRVRQPQAAVRGQINQRSILQFGNACLGFNTPSPLTLSNSTIFSCDFLVCHPRFHCGMATESQLHRMARIVTSISSDRRLNWKRRRVGLASAISTSFNNEFPVVRSNTSARPAEVLAYHILVYAMRRVDCRECGVTVERVPWARGKGHWTTSFRWFLARWAKHMSWDEVACMFRTTWRNVFE